MDARVMNIKDQPSPAQPEKKNRSLSKELPQKKKRKSSQTLESQSSEMEEESTLEK